MFKVTRNNVADYTLDVKLISIQFIKKLQFYLKQFLFDPPMSCKVGHFPYPSVKDREILNFYPENLNEDHKFKISK